MQFKLLIIISFFIINNCYAQPNIPSNDIIADNLERIECIRVDSAINCNIILNNRESVIKNLDSLFLKKAEKNTYNSYKIFPSLFYKNKKGTQYLKVVDFAGANETGCSYFEVGYTRNRNHIRYSGTTDFVDFKTESNIRLGMSKSTFFSIKGKKFRLIKKAKGISIYLFRCGHAFYQQKITDDDAKFIAMYEFNKYNKLMVFGFGYMPVIPN